MKAIQVGLNRTRWRLQAAAPTSDGDGSRGIGSEPSALILGDNIFFGHDLTHQLACADARARGATIFAYHVHDPERYGVVEIDAAGRPVSIVEKPPQPRSRWAVTGLYYYDGEVVEIARSLKPSARGELEITDINQVYLEQGRLFVEKLGRGFAWLDTGTPASLAEAAQFVHALEMRQGLRIGCPEEVAYRVGLIDRAQLERLGRAFEKSDYGRYLLNLED